MKWAGYVLEVCSSPKLIVRFVCTHLVDGGIKLQIRSHNREPFLTLPQTMKVPIDTFF